MQIREFEHQGEHWVVVAYAARKPQNLSQLTKAECEVIGQWTRGETMRSIARNRRVSERTVANQIASAYKKVGVRTRSDLLRALYGPSAQCG